MTLTFFSVTVVTEMWTWKYPFDFRMCVVVIYMDTVMLNVFDYLGMYDMRQTADVSQDCTQN